VSLWEWARVFIRHALGDLADFASEWPTGVAASVCAFLARCWRSPTLGRLASDGAEEAFKLVLMTLLDDMVLVTSRRVNHIKWTTGGETQSAVRVEAFEDWLKRATPRATERAAMGPAFHAHAVRELRSLAPPPLGRRGKQRVRLARELAFALSYVPGWSKGKQERTVAALLSDWVLDVKLKARRQEASQEGSQEDPIVEVEEVTKTVTDEYVRLTTRRGKIDPARWKHGGGGAPAGASRIYVATLPAQYLARAGRLRFNAAGVDTGPGIAAQVRKVAKARRASFLADLHAAGLTVLPAVPAAQGR
jgi:hypothetical protein